MNSEAIPVSTSVPSSSSSSSSSSISSKEAHPLSLPLYLTSTSSSLKPLRERNRTNLKRRINLSRSQVLSNDFENEDNLSVTPKPTTIDKTAIHTASSQPTLPSTRLYFPFVLVDSIYFFFVSFQHRFTLIRNSIQKQLVRKRHHLFIQQSHAVKYGKDWLRMMSNKRQHRRNQQHLYQYQRQSLFYQHTFRFHTIQAMMKEEMK